MNGKDVATLFNSWERGECLSDEQLNVLSEGLVFLRDFYLVTNWSPFSSFSQQVNSIELMKENRKAGIK